MAQTRFDEVKLKMWHNDIKVKDVAERYGCSQQYISKVLRGSYVSDVQVKTITDIVDELVASKEGK